MTTSTTPAVRKSFWTRAKKWIQQAITKPRKQAQASSTTPETGEQHAARLKEAVDKYLETINLDASDDRLIEVVNGHVVYTAGLFQDRGLADGKIGARDYHIRHTAIMYARHIRGQILSRLSGRVKGLFVALTERTKQKEQIGQTLAEQQHKYTDFLDYSQRDHRQFSKLLVRLYGIFAVVLLLADLPLSLNLVGYMKIGTSNASDKFIKKITDVDLVLFSLGICFCTVFIKTLYDEYINNRLGDTAISFTKLQENHKISLGVIRTEYYLKLFVKLLIFALLIVTLFNLGEFRNVFSHLDISKEATTHPNITRVTLIAFIGISIIVPTVSGICLSLSLSIHSNIRALKNLKERVQDLSAQLATVQKESEGLEALKGELEVFAEDWESEEKTILTANMFASGYEHAYKSGFLMGAGNNLATMAAQFQKEEAYQIISDKLSKL